MTEKTCKNCSHFVGWNRNDMPYDGNAEGVCTAPRPALGPEPSREVNGRQGKNCKTYKEEQNE